MALSCEEKLAEAEAAYHALTVGGQASEVWDGDYRVRYTAADPGPLLSYINTLRAQCGPDAGCGCTTSSRRAIRFRLS